MTQDLYWFRKSCPTSSPVEGRSDVLLEPRCSREFGELQAHEWSTDVSDWILSGFLVGVTLPFVVQRKGFLTGEVKIEEREGGRGPCFVVQGC